ncbi:GNAT family N-acetyltransferase [Thermoclostridium stercorarium]|nr:GNAT family N-acetyltransferase [Thermoclostridium stercorarium]
MRQGVYGRRLCENRSCCGFEKGEKKGTGRLICEELIRIGKEKGAKKFVLDAQVQAIGFYQKLGFAVKSDVFIEAGIEHVRMEAVFE